MPELKLIHNHENYRSLHVVTLTLPMCLNIQQFLKTIFNKNTTLLCNTFICLHLHLAFRACAFSALTPLVGCQEDLAPCGRLS